MKPKKKLCDGCGEDKYIWKRHLGDKLCQQCWNSIKYKDADPKPQKPKKKIPSRSKDKAKLDVLYTKLRRIFLEKNPMCQAAFSCCTGRATDVHHKMRRGKNYLRTETWAALCRACHHDIEHVNPKRAEEEGWIIKEL